MSIIVNIFSLFRASYADGRLKGDIKSLAGNRGTQITVEDVGLIFNNIFRCLSVFFVSDVL